VTDVQQELQACKTSLGSIEDRLQKIDTALRGNGRKGLFTEFELLKSKVANLEEFRTDVRRTKAWAAAAALTVIGQLLLSLLQQVLPSV
jgi:hypothetical protein